MKKYVDIEEFDSIDDLLDTAEHLYGPGTFVTIGRMGKRNIGAFGTDVAAHGERVVWPGEASVNPKTIKRRACRLRTISI